MDLHIPPFEDWKAILQEAVDKSDIMLVAMGPEWIDLFEGRRVSGEPDWVRFEVASALARGIPIGPVLLGLQEVPSGNGVARRHAGTLGSSTG